MRFSALPLLLSISCTSAEIATNSTQCERGSAYEWEQASGGDCGSARDVSARQRRAECPATLTGGCLSRYDFVCPDGSSWVWSPADVDAGELRVHLTGPDHCESSYRLHAR